MRSYGLISLNIQFGTKIFLETEKIMNIFISFSGQAREEYAIKFLNFFNKYGLHGWYDQHELLLGDVLNETITKEGIERADYCLLIINKTYLARNWPCEEAIRLYNRFKSEQNYVIFPILLDITKEEIKNSKLNFLLQIKYQFLHSGDTIENIGLQILNRIFFDMVRKKAIFSFESALTYFKRLTLSDSINIYNALLAIKDFDETCYREKTIFLICLIRLFRDSPYEKTIHEISYKIYNNDNISFDIYKITESIFLIGASIFLEKNKMINKDDN